MDGKILRVFPKRTSYTPDDEYVRIGSPLVTDQNLDINEIHISCSFTWDMDYCEQLKLEYENFFQKPCYIGGPAYHSLATDFIPGMYVKKGIIFTSRGCNNNCPWCGVRSMEGKLKELPVVSGNIIQDNNFLQCSRSHKDKVFEMLKHQKGICFRGGLQSNLIDDHFIENIQSLSIYELWLACDTDEALPSFKNACEKLKKAGFPRWKIRCYSLIGHDMEKEEMRNREIYNIGAIPFSQLEMDFSRIKKEYSKEWKRFQRTWQRPAAISAHMKEVNIKNCNLNS